MAKLESWQIIAGIALVGVIIYLSSNATPQALYFSVPNTEEECNHGLQTRIEIFNYQCVSECKMIDEQLRDCLDSCIFSQGSDHFGEWTHFGSTNTCDELGTDECWYLCMVGGDGGCNTDADTDCNGAVDENELVSYAVLWIGGSISEDDLVAAAVAWIIG